MFTIDSWIFDRIIDVYKIGRVELLDWCNDELFLSWPQIVCLQISFWIKCYTRYMRGMRMGIMERRIWLSSSSKNLLNLNSKQSSLLKIKPKSADPLKWRGLKIAWVCIDTGLSDILTFLRPCSHQKLPLLSRTLSFLISFSKSSKKY